jgi:hypothetical protein
VGKCICFGLNYAEPAAESGTLVLPGPLVFNKWTSAIVARLDRTLRKIWGLPCELPSTKAENFPHSWHQQAGEEDASRQGNEKKKSISIDLEEVPN